MESDLPCWRLHEITQPRQLRMQALLIEDNLMFAATLEPALRSAGYAVRTLGSESALRSRLPEAPTDLVVVNLAATRFVGAELIEAIRSQADWERVPILAYAGHVERELFAAGDAAGASLVVPNSAIRSALPEVLEKLRKRVGSEGSGEEVATSTEG